MNASIDAGPIANAILHSENFNGMKLLLNFDDRMGCLNITSVNGLRQGSLWAWQAWCHQSFTSIAYILFFKRKHDAGTCLRSRT